MTQNIIVVICTDISENDADIYPKLSKIQNRFLELYGKDVMDAHWNGERSYFSKFQEEIDRIVLGPVKVSIIGWAGVGKTSLTHLIVGKEVNLEYVPTVTADLANYDRLGSRTIVLWDFAGQIQFTDLWDSLLKGTRIVLLVTDSTYHNVQETKKIMDQFLKKYYSHAIIIGIANKQDLSSRLTPKFVEKILEIPTYGMISINPDYRVVIHEILKHVIEEINRMEGIVDSTGGSL